MLAATMAAANAAGFIGATADQQPILERRKGRRRTGGRQHVRAIGADFDQVGGHDGGSARIDDVESPRTR